ncbi:MAG: pitrilysin family protein [Vulcanimicrobiaceae bacterium]
MFDSLRAALARLRSVPLLAVVAVAIVATRGATSALPVGQDDVLKATLRNGLRVVIVRNALAPVVSTNMTYLVGSRDDPADVPGMAHAQEHMMFRGTHDLATAELGTIATALGGSFNAETSQTLTQYEFTVPASDLETVFHIEADRMRDVLDAQSQWQIERGAIEQEIARDESSPGADFYRDAQAFAFAGTPYAHDGVGTRSAFARLTGPRIKAFYRRWYAPNNAVLVVAGDLDPARTLARIRARFESIPRRPIAAHVPARVESIVRRTIRRPSTLTYPLAVVALQFPGVTSPDFLASFLLQQVLASQRGTIRGLVDAGEALDASWISLPYVPEGQLGMATAALGPAGDPGAAGRRLQSLLRAYAERGIPRELFETTKRQAIANQELSRNSIASLASDWATTIALDNEPSIAREQELLAGVTLADVDRVAKKYLDPAHAIVGELTPSANATQNVPAGPPSTGPEKPLGAQTPVTRLPSWAMDLVERPALPPAQAQPERTRLGNGMTLVVRPATISDSVVAYGAIRTLPELQEPAGQEGVASVLEAMFAFGTQTRDRTVFVRAQDDIDATLGGGTSFGLQTTSRSFDRALALLAENQLHPRFDRATFDLARRRALESLQTQLSGTQSVAARRTAAKLYPAGDPALREPTVASIERLTLDDVRAYYARTYRPDLATLVVVGNVRAAEVRASVERTFGAWRGPGGEPPSLELARAPLNGAGDVTIAQPSLAQDSVTLEELIDADRRSPQFAALTLGNAVLGGGSLGAEQSRLFRDIRQNAGLVYTIASQYNATRTRASFSVDFASSPNDRARIESLVDGEIARMQNEPVGDFELALAKAAIVRRSAIADASIGAIGQALLRASLDGAPFDRERADSAAILATTPAAVRDAFAKFVRRKDFVRVVVGP